MSSAWIARKKPKTKAGLISGILEMQLEDYNESEKDDLIERLHKGKLEPYNNWTVAELRDEWDAWHDPDYG
jgi:hypothetical protein